MALTDPRNSITPSFAVKLFESMADGVFTLDQNGCITSWNPAMQRISGYEPGEAIGQKCQLLKFNRCFGNQCPVDFSECGIFDHGRIDSQECFMRHKDGYDVPIMKSVRLVRDENSTVIGVVETVTDLTELKRTRQQLAEADRKLGERHRLDNIIGKSEVMQKVFAAVEAAAASDATILIQGESGTGKELVAGAIHHNSARSAGPLVTVNCSALSESLLESELFGHVKGAFTGAVRDRAGRFEEADGGTIFLDEVAEISPFIQVKLLRVLQQREVERVGDSRKRKMDIRILTATNKNLLDLVKKGEFREDLYYRLKVFPIQIPPLKARKQDIPLLAHNFIQAQNQLTGKQVQGLSADAMRLLMDYQWPGNVRELENAIEHAFVLSQQDDTINVFDLPVEIRMAEYHQPDPHRPVSSVQVQKMTASSLTALLHECDWNKAAVARRTGMNRTTIWKYMKKWDIPLKAPYR
ncbi:MAG: sigma-54 interaction domain-containing protein [Desulfosudaceae bacterium]